MKYYIIPKDEIVMELDATNADEAVIDFATKMDMDMNQYFRAVTEEEYEQIKSQRLIDSDRESKISFYTEELEENFDVPEEDIPDVAENAYDIYCDAGHGAYCDVETEYDALMRAYDEWFEEKGEE